MIKGQGYRGKMSERGIVWLDCEKQLPKQKAEGSGRYSVIVDVILSDGTKSEDWLINDNWVIYCKKNGGAFPIKWRYKDGV